MKKYNIDSLRKKYNIKTEEKNDWVHTFSFVIIILFMAFILLSISFLGTAFIYWLFTLVMANFFSVIIPFTWHYALGVWLIVILIRLTFSGVRYATSTKN